MPQWSSLAAFGAELAGLERDLTGPEQERITRLQGKEAQKIAAAAASQTLGGDRGFSGWNRGAVLHLDTRLFKIRGGHVMAPTRRGAGPWTVAEFGRNQGNAAGFSGPGINRRSGITSKTKSGGVRRVRASRSRRWNGVTQGRNTATIAHARMQRELPRIADREVLKVTRRRFTVT